MSSGVQISKNGAVIGTGADLDVTTVGFRPRRVEIVNTDGLVTAVWNDCMAEGRGFKRVTAGTMSQMAAGEGITSLANGFRIGVDADVNVDGEKIVYVAHE